MQKPNIAILTGLQSTFKKLGRCCLIPPWNGNIQKPAADNGARHT